MKIAVIITTLLAVVCACSTASPPPPPAGSPAQMELDAEALSNHANSIDAYRDWLVQVNEQLLDQQRELDDLIAATKATPQGSLLAADQQYRLLREMTDMQMDVVQLQTGAQQASQFYSTLTNMLRAQAEATKDVLKNMK